MNQERFVMPNCGCIWNGETLEHGCMVSNRIRMRMRILEQAGQSENDEWYRLNDELERDHTP